jgi:hypothetical protein
MPQCASTTALVEHWRESAAARVEQMQTPPRSTPRETTEAIVRNIGRELADIEQAMGRCRGDSAAEPVLTGTWMAHLLIDTARRPQRINAPE